MVKERKLTANGKASIRATGCAREAIPGTWTPLIDVVDVFPGNRSVSRRGEYNLYDAPVGVEHKIEEATKVPMTFDGEVEWEAEGIGALYMWQEDGKHHQLYYTSGDRVCYAVSDNAYHWIRPELARWSTTAQGRTTSLASLPAAHPDFSRTPRRRRRSGSRRWELKATGMTRIRGSSYVMRVRKARGMRPPSDGTLCSTKGLEYRGPKVVLRGWMVGWTPRTASTGSR